MMIGAMINFNLEKRKENAMSKHIVIVVDFSLICARKIEKNDTNKKFQQVRRTFLNCLTQRTKIF
jgi:hypothetical protein